MFFAYHFSNSPCLSSGSQLPTIHLFSASSKWLMNQWRCSSQTHRTPPCINERFHRASFRHCGPLCSGPVCCSHLILASRTFLLFWRIRCSCLQHNSACAYHTDAMCLFCPPFPNVLHWGIALGQPYVSSQAVFSTRISWLFTLRFYGCLRHGKVVHGIHQMKESSELSLQSTVLLAWLLLRPTKHLPVSANC